MLGNGSRRLGAPDMRLDQGQSPIVAINDLTVQFKGTTQGFEVPLAVDAVSLSISEGESVGLVGESGCGKTTVARAAVGLVNPTRGDVTVGGLSLRGASRRDRRAIARKLQIVFQDPTQSLNPKLTVLRQLAEPLAIHRLVESGQRRQRARELLRMVGLSEQYLARRPGGMSGGERQRVAIARALAVNPIALILDEPVTALDVSVQAQILRLLSALRRERGLAYLFISHDLSVVRIMCSRLLVMYLGRIVERGQTRDVYRKPGHPYTQTLLRAARLKEPHTERSQLLAPTSEPTDLAGNLLEGCLFRARCPLYLRLGSPANCREDAPALRVGPSGSEVACHYPREAAAGWSEVELASPAQRVGGAVRNER